MKSNRFFKTILKAVIVGDEDMFGYPAQPYVILIIFLVIILIIGTVAASLT